MASLVFTIYGNQEKPEGNPIPYFRITSQSKWSTGAKRYHAWCEFVRANYFDALKPLDKIAREDFGDAHDLLQKKPIPATNGRKQKMSLKIVFANKAHADCDNIFKGIADALFMNDKYLVSDGFDFTYGKQGSVTITLDL